MQIYIDPLKIQNFIGFKKKKIIAYYDNIELNARRYNGRRFSGLIVEDNAIRTGASLGICPHIKGTFQRFQEKLNWQETEYRILYKSWYQKIDNGKHKRKSFQKFYENRLQHWDKIFHEIETKGYKKSKNQQDNVEIAIGSRGQFLLIDGRHRVAFAQILQLKQIPVIVNIVSETLVKSFKDETFANSFADRNVAEAFAANSAHFARQLCNEDIKDRLAIASMAT